MTKSKLALFGITAIIAVLGLPMTACSGGANDPLNGTWRQ